MTAAAITLSLLALAITGLAKKSSDHDFDLFILVRSYSPTFCLAEECTRRPVQAFTIHGLWPEYDNGAWPEYCNTSGGGSSSSSSGQCEWPSFHGSDEAFWQHEWDRHGSCAVSVIGERPDYFAAVMRLHEQFDLDLALAAAGIIPSNKTSYPARAVARAVEDAFRVQPLLNCHRGQLLEVWLCVGLDLQVRQCPTGVVRAFQPTCGKTVSLPVGSAVSAECKPFFPPWNAPGGGSGAHAAFIRILTGLAAAAAGAAAVALFVRGVARARRPTLAEAFPEQPYDRLSSWCPPKPRSLE
ncbi:hypothetical protein ABPG77_006038 [Micractinium sp. CCAP 211/92]